MQGNPTYQSQVQSPLIRLQQQQQPMPASPLHSPSVQPVIHIQQQPPIESYYQPDPDHENVYADITSVVSPSRNPMTSTPIRQTILATKGRAPTIFEENEDYDDDNYVAADNDNNSNNINIEDLLLPVDDSVLPRRSSSYASVRKDRRSSAKDAFSSLSVKDRKKIWMERENVFIKRQKEELDKLDSQVRESLTTLTVQQRRNIWKQRENFAKNQQMLSTIMTKRRVSTVNVANKVGNKNFTLFGKDNQDIDLDMFAADKTKFERYEKMRRMQLPQAAIEQKMTMDGLSSAERDYYFNEFQNKFNKYSQMAKLNMPEATIADVMARDGIAQEEIQKFLNKRNDKLETYTKMLRLGLPEGFIVQRMQLDNISSQEVDQFFSKHRNKFHKYIKMRKMRLPELVILQRMRIDGISEPEIAAFAANDS